MASLVATFLVYGIYGTINFISGDNCEEREKTDPGYCGAEWKTHPSAGNSTFVDINGYEKLAASLLFATLLLVRMLFLRRARMKAHSFDKELTTPSDFTVKLSGLPQKIQLKNWLSQIDIERQIKNEWMDEVDLLENELKDN